MYVCTYIPSFCGGGVQSRPIQEGYKAVHWLSCVDLVDNALAVSHRSQSAVSHGSFQVANING